MTGETVVLLRALRKTYGDVRALDGAEAVLPAGAVGLLGPNGSGKTTLIKILLGLLRSDGGEARVLGLDPRSARGRLGIRRSIGYMPESDCLLPGMTGVELVASLGRIAGLSRQDAMTRAHEALDYVGLDEERYRSLEEYSTGMKQRLKLAQALVHDPGYLLLDEPTNGLDPKGRRHMLDLVWDLGHVQGKNLLICSHILPDIEATCDHTVLLNKGRVVRVDSLAELTATREPVLELATAGEPTRLREALEARGYAVRQGERRLEIRLSEGEEDADRVLAVAAEAGVAVESLARRRSTLEQAFLAALGLPVPGAEARA